MDVTYLQSLKENKNAVFQVASNFNGVEATSEASSPDTPNFTEKYIWDPTQGTTQPPIHLMVVAYGRDQRWPLSSFLPSFVQRIGPAASISAGAAAIARVHAAFYHPDLPQDAWGQTRDNQVACTVLQ